jgi:hypothetical protein
MSAFAPFATATLLFQVPTGSLSNPLGDPATATTPLIVVAYLKSDRSYRQQPTPEGQVAGQAVVGRCIAPTTMPPGVQAEQMAEAVFWRAGLGATLVLPPEGFDELSDYQDFLADNAEAIAITGEFYWEANLPGGFGVEQVLGDRIRGRFVARSSWADTL